MIPLKMFGIFLAKALKYKNLKGTGIHYDAFVSPSFDEHLCFSSAGRPLYQRQQAHLFSLIYLLCGHRMTPQNDTRGLFFSASLYACLHLVKAFLSFFFLRHPLPRIQQKQCFLSRKTVLLLLFLF